MATTPQFLIIGRVGALAVALGIGAAIAGSTAIAAADDGTPSSESSQRTSESDAGQRNQESAAPAESPDKTGDTQQTDAAAEITADDTRVADAESDEGTEDVDGPENTRHTVDTGEDGDDGATTRAAVEIASPEPAEMRTPAGSARRELAPSTSPSAETAAPTNQTTAPANQTAAVKTSPLATSQQLEAERIAAQTVRTWPVQLMKLILGIGWSATAQREYEQIGGPDAENKRQLWRSVDEYAMGAAFQQQLLNPMLPTVVTQVAPPHIWYGRNVSGSRILYDNPDTVYRFMGVNMTSTYVITGRFTGQMPADTNFSVLTGLSGVTADNLSGRQIDIGEDGSFTITVSGEAATPGQRNHLQMSADTTLIAVRNTLSDWTTQPPMTLSIERLSGPRNSLFSQLGGFAIPGLGPLVTRSPLLTFLVSLIPPMKTPPPILRGAFTAVVMALGLGMESKYIKVATTDAETGERVAPNVLRTPSRNAEFLATQLQSAGYFELADDQALVVTITPANARYFTVPVTNLWTVTDNYWDVQTSLNNAQAVANPDGTYTLVISPTDPGVYNWVSTGGLNRGTVSIRFQDLDLSSSVTPTLTSKVVAVSDLADVLPPTTTYVNETQRAIQLAIRRHGFDRRFGAAH